MNQYPSNSKLLTWLMALALAGVIAGCGGGGGGGGGSGGSGTFGPAAVLPGAGVSPTVSSSTPIAGATGVGVTGAVLTATFSQAMNPATIVSVAPTTSASTFSLKVTSTGVNVPGTVTMNPANTIATFTPSGGPLAPLTQHTATISTAAMTNAVPGPSVAITAPVSWTFTTAGAGSIAAPNLGAAGNFTILTKTGIDASGAAGTLVTGNIGVSPALAGSITGFALSAPPTTFTTSALVVGQVFAPDYDPPTPANLTTAVLDMEAAFTDAAGRPAGVGPNLNLLAGILTPAQTLAPGVYTWNVPGNVSIPANLTLSGSATDVWIFQITGTLDLETNIQILLAGGAMAKNVFWQVSGAVTLKPNSHFEGVILAQTNIAMQTSATANARFLAQTAVTLQGNPVTPPAP